MVIEPESPTSPVTIERVPRTIRMYSVSDQELDVFGAMYGSINATFFGLSAGAAVAFLITVLSASDDLNNRLFAIFVALLTLSAVGVLYFGIRMVADYRTAGRHIRRIREC